MLSDLGESHPVVRARDYYALWIFRLKEARGQVSLIYRSAVITGGAVVVLRDTPYAKWWWVAPVIVGILGLVVAAVNDWGKVPNAENRVNSTRAGNYVDPRTAIRLIIQAKQIDEAVGTEGRVETETRRALQTHIRGIDMEQFNGDLKQ